MTHSKIFSIFDKYILEKKILTVIEAIYKIKVNFTSTQLLFFTSSYISEGQSNLRKCGIKVSNEDNYFISLYKVN